MNEAWELVGKLSQKCTELLRAIDNEDDSEILSIHTEIETVLVHVIQLLQDMDDAELKTRASRLIGFLELFKRRNALIN